MMVEPVRRWDPPRLPEDARAHRLGIVVGCSGIGLFAFVAAASLVWMFANMQWWEGAHPTPVYPVWLVILAWIAGAAATAGWIMCVRVWYRAVRAHRAAYPVA